MSKPFVTLLLVLSLSPSAFAYIDPGSGSIILQAIIAGAFGIFATLGLWKDKLLRLFKKGNKEDNRIEDAPDKE
ncbi:hypothetical protein [Vibrio breoganii]|uniref:hypothetical protein n=1 Tax=Vibrio breoganii TaxID=553239 RepID=UPI0021C382C5|nr:hypothetical protein [Vibrio breoganii]MDN3717487.1 hypothetical protein [Vibrio breoganii]